MKKKTMLRGVVCLGVGMLLSAPMFPGRTAAAIPQAAEGQSRAGMRDALQQAVEGLNLNDDQKTKVKGIFDEAKTKRESIFKDTSLTPDQKREKMKGLREDTLGKVNGVLTPDQQTQLKEKMEAMKAAHQGQAGQAPQQ
jgi:Spy/CpxP family protein refolding chaperone